MTVFAGDDELLTFLHHEPRGRNIMSEITDKAYMREPASWPDALNTVLWCRPPLSDVVPAIRTRPAPPR